MSPAFRIVGIAAAAFASTSLDNLGALIAFFATRGFRASRVAAGYLGVIWLVVAAAWGTSRLAIAAPEEWIGYLGVVPIGLGVWRLWRIRAPIRPARAPDGEGALAVALVTLAQNADNFAVFTCLFADSARPLHGAVFASLSTSAVGWCALGFWLARRTALAAPLQRAMRVAFPFLLIALGVYIVAATATDLLHFPVGG